MPYNPSALQLTHVLQQIYRRLGGVVITLTDGSTTLAVDTKLTELLGEGNVDDFVNGGTLIVIDTEDGAAPIGEFTTITDYDSTTNAFTLSPALTAPLSVGDRVMYVGPDFPLYDVLEIVNDGLRYAGDIPVPDVSLSTLDNVTEYTLPAAIRGREILDVEYQTRTDVADFGFYPVDSWTMVPGSTVLTLPYLTAGYQIRITYRGTHPRVENFDDNINEHFHPELVHSAVLAHVVQWRNDQNSVQGSPDESLTRMEQKAWSQFDRARIMHPVRIPPRRINSMPHFQTNWSVRKYGL